MSQPKSKYPDRLSETYGKATSLNDSSSSRERSAASSNSQNSILFTRRNSDEVHVFENYGESIEDDVFSDGNVEVVDYSENERTRPRHQSDGDVGVVATLEPSQSGTVTQDDEDTDPLFYFDRLKFRNRSRSPQGPRNLTSSNRSDDTRTRDANRRSSRDNESSYHGGNRGTNRAYAEESSFKKRKNFDDSHHSRSVNHHERRSRSRHYERDEEQRGRKRSRSLPRRHHGNSRGLDQDYDRGFKYYGPRGNSRRGKNSRFPHWNNRYKKFEHQNSFYGNPNFKRKNQYPPAASTQFLKDNTFPSKIHMNYHGSSEMAGSSQSAKLRDQYLRTERESVNKDMNVESQSTQTSGNWVVTSSTIEKEQDNSVVIAPPTTTQNCNVRSSPECSVSPSHVPVASNGDGGPTAREILEKLRKCPYCIFYHDSRKVTRKHLKESEKKVLCMFCLPNIYCVEERSVGALWDHFYKDHVTIKEDPRARCTLCDQVFTFDGIYIHMSKMHFKPIEKKKEEKEKSCTNVQSEAASSCSSSPPNSSSPIVEDNNRPTTSDTRTRMFGENVNSTAGRLVGTEGRAANRRSVDLIHPQRADQVPRQHALNANPRIHTQGTQRNDDVEENIRSASRNHLSNYRIPKKTKPN